MSVDLEPAVTLPWLVRLRWSFLAGQLIILPIMHYWFGLAVNEIVIVIELAIMAASNVGLMILHPRRRWSTARVIGAVMILDTCLVTLFLVASGGSANPFTVLYLVNIALSAIVLDTWWTMGIAALSLAGFALLFVGATDHTAHMHGSGFDRHLQAMWAAFFIAAALIAFFVSRVTRAIAAQRAQIARLRETNERNERLASVTRLAANAAHELGSPLATIAIAAHEAKRHLDAPSGRPVAADLDLIAQEVERCQHILERMSAQGSQSDAGPVTLGELSDLIRDSLGEDRSKRIELRLDDPAVSIALPGEQLAQSVVALVKNALEACDERVVVAFEHDPGEVRIAVEDHGTGIADDVMAKIGTPFFTTKGAGRGLGLGVFLARAFVESHGGGLSLHSTAGHGTSAVVHLPKLPA